MVAVASVAMSTFITRLDSNGSGIRLAVKDLIDMEGLPTTAGCRAVAGRAEPAPADARCLAGARGAGARIVGRTNLHELALGVTGVNPWFGTPRNPLDPTLVPGGSSSGAAVAVMTDEADVAFGSDTGGSVRIPAACCGGAGLKTTWGRIPLDGVWPLSPSFDTIGPLARDVAGLVEGMALLEPGFAPTAPQSWRVGRLVVDAHPDIDAAVDRALAATEWAVDDVALADWEDVTVIGGLLLVAEAFTTNRVLLEQHPEGIGDDVRARLRMGDGLPASDLEAGRRVQSRWRQQLDDLFTRFDLLATPTLTIFPPPLDHGEELLMARCTLPVNLAGVPAVALPVASSGPLPASVQLIAPAGGEERLLAAGRVLEAAAAGS
jgi:amidase